MQLRVQLWTTTRQASIQCNGFWFCRSWRRLAVMIMANHGYGDYDGGGHADDSDEGECFFMLLRQLYLGVKAGPASASRSSSSVALFSDLHSSSRVDCIVPSMA